MGRARAKMVWGTCAETKGPRLQGRNPASNNSPRDPFSKPTFVKEKPQPFRFLPKKRALQILVWGSSMNRCSDFPNVRYSLRLLPSVARR